MRGFFFEALNVANWPVSDRLLSGERHAKAEASIPFTYVERTGYLILHEH